MDPEALSGMRIGLLGWEPPRRFSPHIANKGDFGLLIKSESHCDTQKAPAHLSRRAGANHIYTKTKSVELLRSGIQSQGLLL